MGDFIILLCISLQCKENYDITARVADILEL